VNDVRYALRTLSRQPSYTLAAVATLTLGITVNTVAFSLIDSLVLRPMPVPDAARVFRAYPVDDKGVRGNLFSYPDYLDYRQAADGVEPRAAMGYVVSANYFDLTGVRAALGRVLGGDDERAGSRAALGQSFWRARFGADPAAIGSTLTLNGTPFTVVGVAAAGFAGTEPLVADYWVSLPALSVVDVHDPLDRDHPELLVVGRAAPTASRAQVARSLAVAAQRLAMAYPGRTRPASINVAPGTFFSIDPGLTLMIAGVMAVVGLVLFIACANAANLALARAASRRREIALRLAIGAGRGRIVRQLLAEAMLVGLAAGAAALLAAEWALRELYRIGMSLAALPWAITLNLEPDIRVYAWTTAIALASGAALGLLPALQASSPRLARALHGDELYGGRVRGTTLRHALVVAQVAASLVLLFCAGLLLRALARAETLDLGFRTAGVIYADYDPRAARYTPARSDAFNTAMLESAAAMPGVTAAGLTTHVPLHGGVRMTTVHLAGKPGALTEPRAILSWVSPSYFRVLQIPFVAGHGFDVATAAPTVVVSEGLARRFWPGEPALGKVLSVTESPAPRTVVGVVRDAANGAIWRDKEQAVYLPADASADPRDLRILVRTTADTASVRRLLAERAAGLGGDMRFAPITLDELLHIWLLPSRVAMAGVAVLAIMALALACVGLYGVLAFAVNERSRELGIRMALGADARAVMRLILGDASRLVLAGLVIGSLCALPATPFLGRLLFGVSPFDPVTLVLAAAVLTVVALAAAYRPARHAARLEPLAVLRID
jgi:predicted permease